ncbi:gamma-glutamyl-gamma-aminobutyrate hydrolase family protein [Evansella sp. AB-P1]|uniref:gamma-glutamyl-gamma-aminobutyrate hydrolase family protein n=1 Tax=Evansella sp. AB-P1 TaxID=3037653 RepID=UPI00241E5889|nr:gamma-glutamyl-gamma-aminobutyrate hydrolase family protein [Evansella sp. AB-P1]MDG5787126.1 gamma-glutamyl-gamma-aminobutyrate hydrolase family protein [Evansella sp. AB-P1]
MNKPMIGVLPLYDEEKESYWMLPGYMKGIELAGGIPVMLPLTMDVEIIESIVHSFAGFLFTGGHDVDPLMYGEREELFCGDICGERDRMEELLFQMVVEMDKPAFGICRGIQLFNALLGGTLYQDIPTQYQTNIQVNHKQKPPYDHPAHCVFIDKESPLYEILQKDSLYVNSYHHQGIKALSKDLTPMAKAEDDLIEGVYMPNKKFVLAVQWHPEFDYKEESSSRLFKAFVDGCNNE